MTELGPSLTALVSGGCFVAAVLVGSGHRARARRRAAPAPPRGSRPRSTSRPGTTPVPVPLLLDLVAAALAAGLDAGTALTAVATCLRQAGDPRAGAVATVAARSLTGGSPDGPRATEVPADLASLTAALDLSAATGLGPVELVRTAASDQRRLRAAAQILAARRLGVWVLVPTGLLLLPAFVLLTVVPLVLDLLLG